MTSTWATTRLTSRRGGMHPWPSSRLVDNFPWNGLLRSENEVTCSPGQEEKIMSLVSCLKMKWIALAKARGVRCNLLDSTGVGTSSWCSLDVPPWVCTSVGVLEDLHSTSYELVDPYSTSNDVMNLFSTSGDVLDLWCQSTDLRGSTWCWKFARHRLYTLGKYCIHLMSGLGSGMPNV